MPELAFVNRSVQSVQTNSARADFLDLLGGMWACLGNRRPFDALPDYVKSPSPRLREVIQQKSFQQKTSVPTGTTTDSSWAGPLALYAPLSAGFVEMVSLFSAYEKIAPDSRRTLLKTMLPVENVPAMGTAITEAASLPPSQMSFTLVDLDEKRVGGIIVSTTEVTKFARPESVTLLGNDLARTVALASDQVLLDQLTAGAGSTHLSSGSTTSAFVADFAHALDMISYGSNAKLYFIAGADAIKRLASIFQLGGSPTAQFTATGGMYCGVKFIISDAATDAGFLVDASQCATYSDVITLDMSIQADVKMNGSTLRLWQQNEIGMKALRFLGVQLLRSSACSLITGMTTTA